jgi:hypothetical protein
MKVNLISDLHLEFSTDFTLPGGDVLIVAGDMCEAKNLRQERYQDWIFENFAKYREVVYVLGNHEHYGMRVQKTKEFVEEYLPNNVRVLENQTHVIDDVLFVGGTLWTDMNRGDPLTLLRCQQDMSDYRHITMYDSTKQVYHKLTPAYTTVMHQATRDYIVETCRNNPDKKIVVVTHMLPSMSAISEQYREDHTLNGAYASNLDNIFWYYPNIRVWCFGHTHSFIDMAINETRLLCNPRGYAGMETRAMQFDPAFSFEV